MFYSADIAIFVGRFCLYKMVRYTKTCLHRTMCL